MGADPRQLTTSEHEWVDMRAYLRNHRSVLDSAAARGFPDALRVADTTLLSRPEWLPDHAVRLQDVRLEWCSSSPQTPVTVDQVVPIDAGGHRYRSYAEAVGAVAAPAVFENRPTYRLLDADLIADPPVLRCGLGSYFDSINVGEAAAHEFAAAQCYGTACGGVRAGIADPCDTRQRPVNVAVSTLTVRRDPTTASAAFVLHWRDPRKVGHAGGLYQVVPVGIFQPSGYADWNVDNDFSLWRTMVRELAEELGGAAEDHGSEHAPIDYESWDFAARLSHGLAEGTVDAYCLGLGVDPLSFATDLLTVVVIDALLFDDLFGVDTHNAEGRLIEL